MKPTGGLGVAVLSLCLVFSVVCATDLRAQTQPVRAAFMYSGFNEGRKSFLGEYDAVFEDLGWEVEKFENTQAEELSNRLEEFDIVVGSSVSNYENPVDFSPYAALWLNFLDQGGAVLCTDASYTQLLDLWIGRISEDFALRHALCSAYTDPSEETRAVTFTDDDALLTTPNDLRPLLSEKHNWAHLVVDDENWRTPVRCYDDAAVFAYRPVGKGLLIVTNYFNMRVRTSQPIARALLENTIAFTKCRARGVEVANLQLGQNVPGTNTLSTVLKNVGEGGNITLQMMIEYDETGEQVPVGQVTMGMAVGSFNTVNMSFELTRRGPYTVALSFKDTANEPFFTIRRRFVLPEVIEFDLWPRHLYPHQRSINPLIRLTPDQGTDLAATQLEVRLVGAGGAGRPVVIDRPGTEVETRLPLDNLPPGEYHLAARLLANAAAVGTAEIPLMLHPQPKVYYDERNVTHVDGEPFFPLGFYMVTWQFDKDDVADFIDVMAATGFNTVHIGARNLDDFSELLDQAHRLGLKVIVEGLQGMNTVERFKTHPAVIAWNSGDEPDGAGVPPESVAATVDRLKTIDPERLVYTTLCVPDEYENYIPWMEVVSVDPYPVQNARVNLKYVAECVVRAREAAGDVKPLWVVPQAFGGYGSWKVPTADQARNMTYQALIEGADGLIYYVYRDGLFYMAEHPELWEGMKRIAEEVHQLTPVLMGPAHDGVRFTAGPEGQVRCLAVRHGEAVTVLAVNTSEDDLGEVTLENEVLPGGRALVLFEDRSVQAETGVLRDAFGPAAVRVYELPLPAGQ